MCEASEAVYPAGRSTHIDGHLFGSRRCVALLEPVYGRRSSEHPCRRLGDRRRLPGCGRATSRAAAAAAAVSSSSSTARHLAVTAAGSSQPLNLTVTAAAMSTTAVLSGKWGRGLSVPQFPPQLQKISLCSTSLMIIGAIVLFTLLGNNTRVPCPSRITATAPRNLSLNRLS